MKSNARSRIVYIDWLRGLACVVMFQTHCYDSWLGGAARRSTFMRYSQIGGTLPAPLFLFLAGIALAFTTDRMRQKGMAANAIARTSIRRGGEIFLLALLFRVQEYVLSFFHSPWTDLLRVDILNVIAVTLVLMAIVCWIVGRIASGAPIPPASEGAGAASANDAALRVWNIAAAIGAAVAIALATPPLWTTARPSWLPWFLESYVNGVHIFGVPQVWLFPIFPWAAFGFAGLAAGFLLSSANARQRDASAVTWLGFLGVALFAMGWWFDSLPARWYAVYDFWHTSPNWFLMRVGVMLVIVFLGYAWCRWGAGEIGFSPLVKMGQTSLIVYWVHIEFVYGDLSIMPKHGVGIGRATLGLAIIFVAMTLLAMARTRWKGRGAEMMAWFRRPAAKS
ncbi:MAG: heparan-alpha-glucosaminide N-acetyltransferase domain-containing protein [Candidatus Acidiferrales bacterium]